MLQCSHKQFCGHFKEFLELYCLWLDLVYMVQISWFQDLLNCPTQVKEYIQKMKVIFN